MSEKNIGVIIEHGLADPIAATTPCGTGCARSRKVHADKELEVFTSRIIKQIAKSGGYVCLGWVPNVQGKSVKSSQVNRKTPNV